MFGITTVTKYLDADVGNLITTMTKESPHFRKSLNHNFKKLIIKLIPKSDFKKFLISYFLKSIAVLSKKIY